MSNSKINENLAAFRSAIANALGLDLSDEEVKNLLLGEPISFEQLVESRSLSEVGLALIRSDALIHQSQVTENLNVGKSCIQICEPLTGRCFPLCISMPKVELRLDPDWLK